MPCVVTFIQGLHPGVRRGLAFLQIHGEKHVNAKQIFEALTDKIRLDVLNRFQHWQDGQVHPDYHHGWKPPNEHCYVFRWRRGKVRYRIYGFLIHPRQTTDAQFVACILVSYAQKSEQETDPAHLSVLNKLRTQPEVVQAVNEKFVKEDKKTEKGAQ